MKTRLLFLLLGLTLMPMTGWAQTVDPLAYYTDDDGDAQESNSISDAQAPLTVIFRPNATDMEGYSPSYEWHFQKMDGAEAAELFVRYEEETEYTFRESGTYHVVLKTRLEENGAELEDKTITITIAESKLVFPNAFSPNGDGINDTYKAKEYRSIVKFHAIIVNRWGQKLYEWDDPAGEWDGKHNGHDVKDGVYFVQVIAKGADGKDYHIRKDVNLLRGYYEGGTTSGNQ